MVAKGEDKRVRRTKKAIREALLRLMQDKAVAQVTTTELCREADINRNTFYAHYSTPEDVFAEIEKELLAELTAMVENGYDEGKVTLEMCRAIEARRRLQNDSRADERAYRTFCLSRTARSPLRVRAYDVALTGDDTPRTRTAHPHLSCRCRSAALAPTSHLHRDLGSARRPRELRHAS